MLIKIKIYWYVKNDLQLFTCACEFKYYLDA